MDSPFQTAVRSTLLSLFIVSTTVSVAIADDSQNQTIQYKDVIIGLNDVFVPGGFDSNTEAYVVASGLFPNGCYKWKSFDVKNNDNFNHEIKSYASVSQGMCIMVLIPFTKEIRFGKLAKGLHTLKFLNGDGTYLKKTMSIE